MCRAKDDASENIKKQIHNAQKHGIRRAILSSRLGLGIERKIIIKKSRAGKKMLDSRSRRNMALWMYLLILSVGKGSCREVKGKKRAMP